jgi:excisionase family DNA binding protein
MDVVELCANDRARIDALLEMVGVSTHKFDDALVSCTEAARLLGITPKTISMMLRDGRLRKVTIGRSTGIRLSDIEEKRREA